MGQGLGQGGVGAREGVWVGEGRSGAEWRWGRGGMGVKSRNRGKWAGN